MGEADNYYKNANNGNGQRGGPPMEQAYYNNNNNNYSNGQYQQPPYNGGGYQQQPPPPPQQQHQQNGQAPPYSEFPDEKNSFDQAFKIAKPKWNDLWAGILLIAVFAGFVAVSGIAIHGYAANFSFNGGGIYGSSNDFSLNTNTIILFAFVLVVSFVLSIGYVALARTFPKQFIWVTGILNVVFAIGTAIFYFIRKYWSAAIVFLLFGLFMAFCFWTWIKKIPWAALMLKTTIDISKKYGHVYLVSLIGGIIATAFGAWYSVTLVAIYVKYQPADNNGACQSGGGSCSQAKVIGLIAFVTFAMYWISEWLKNTIHATIAGVYGSWYFCVHNFPKDATRASARRALTYSFGSIAFGSLIIAIIQCLRQLCSIARNQSRGDGGFGGMAGYALFCFLGCLIGILEWAIRFFNRYAFCHIALYGKAYIPAAKDTWSMMKDRGLDGLVNDCLIGPVLSFGALFIGYACALLAYLYLLFTKPGYNSDGDYTPVVVAFAFLVGFQIANVFTTPIASGTESIFVAAGWDPQVMGTDHPELYADMVKVYPRVRQAIRVR